MIGKVNDGDDHKKTESRSLDSRFAEYLEALLFLTCVRRFVDHTSSSSISSF